MPFDWKVLAAVGMCASLAACQDANKLALQVGARPPEAAKLRIIETRRFDARDATALLASATATLQDLGYIVSESAPGAGVIVATKERDAEEAGQVVGQVMLTIAMAALGVANNPTWDKTQAIHVTFVVAPTDSPNTQEVRVSFDRYVTNNHGVLWRTELVTDPKIYSDFYDRLTHGMSLEKQT